MFGCGKVAFELVKEFDAAGEGGVDREVVASRACFERDERDFSYGKRRAGSSGQ